MIFVQNFVRKDTVILTPNVLGDKGLNMQTEQGTAVKKITFVTIIPRVLIMSLLESFLQLEAVTLGQRREHALFLSLADCRTVHTHQPT